MFVLSVTGGGWRPRLAGGHRCEVILRPGPGGSAVPGAVLTCAAEAEPPQAQDAAGRRGGSRSGSPLTPLCSHPAGRTGPAVAVKGARTCGLCLRPVCPGGRSDPQDSGFSGRLSDFPGGTSLMTQSSGLVFLCQAPRMDRAETP